MSSISNAIDLCYTSCLKKTNVSYSRGIMHSKVLPVNNIMILVTAAWNGEGEECP